ncbi:hypothetical protein L228DRAFT_243710 [Xylona heveae TC161]|uniref:Uncharacterized protein n=1 Tax=Xylona heveae (strain CBS 132557 / TC161) TaxID=1328760 RepID=A0A165IIU2_XYLHT|nr:hypothetical protein L228DRAFT_243710 [Xylona heveae TC161]KZF24952.1 hypothetical protein L228DRAFT_243710 [Xylona heveae TC161]
MHPALVLSYFLVRKLRQKSSSRFPAKQTLSPLVLLCSGTKLIPEPFGDSVSVLLRTNSLPFLLFCILVLYASNNLLSRSRFCFSPSS